MISDQLTVLFLGDITAATVFSPVVANETSIAYKRKNKYNTIIFYKWSF